MKTTRPTVLAALVAASWLSQPIPAHAQTQPIAATASAVHLAPGPTRAEVLADLQVWRSSGLADYELDPSLVFVGSRGYQAARARYGQMRASPEFHALVQSIATRTGEVVPQRVAANSQQAK